MPQLAPWSWVLIGALLASSLFIKGGPFILLKVVKALWPLAVAYLVFRGIRTWMRRTLNPTDPEGKPVLEVCQRCGQVRQGLWHKCSR